MDGKKPPMNKVQEIQEVIEPYQKKYGHYLSKIRPLREFCTLAKPEGDIKARLEANLTYFQINYALLFAVLFSISLLMKPSSLMVIGLLSLVWVAFLRKNDDPHWIVNIAGIELGKSHRWMVLGLITALVLLTVLGQLFFSAAMTCAVLVVIHGVLHPVDSVTADPSETAELGDVAS